MAVKLEKNIMDNAHIPYPSPQLEKMRAQQVQGLTGASGYQGAILAGWPPPETDEEILRQLVSALAQTDEQHKRSTASLRRIVEILSEKITLPAPDVMGGNVSREM